MVFNSVRVQPVEQMKQEHGGFSLWSSNYKRCSPAKSAQRLKAVETGNITVACYTGEAREDSTSVTFSSVAPPYLLCIYYMSFYFGVGIQVRVAGWQKPTDEAVQPPHKRL